MKVAIIYDRVNKYGGAERFLETITSIFPTSPIFTLVHEPSSAKWSTNKKIIATFLNKVPFFRSRHEMLAPLAPLAFESIDLSVFDLIISVTSSDAKSVLTRPGQKHVCICLTPTRYLWKGAKNYKQDWKMRLLPRAIFNYFRFVDHITAQRPDYYIAISAEVKKRIKKFYQRKSTVIYPPVNNIFFDKHKKLPRKEFYLVVCRLVPYKKVDLVIECFNRLKRPLVVIGGGSEGKKLKKMSSQNITFLGEVGDKELIKYYTQAKALIFPGLEDFGLTPLESQALGTPVIAYKAGGAKETVIDGVTGVFFKRQTVDSLTKAINRFEKVNIMSKDCVKNAKKFSEHKFKEELLCFVDRVANT